MHRNLALLSVLLLTLGAIQPLPAQDVSELSNELDQAIEADRKLTQVMVDKIFSFSELGFQERETSAYLVSLLRENGFQVEEGISDIPTAWWATWGSGRPVIALGSDIDGIPRANQKPGVAYHDPLVEGAPGHGEGHNSGQAVNVTAALALKEVMEREGIDGTLVLWPGVAESSSAPRPGSSGTDGSTTWTRSSSPTSAAISAWPGAPPTGPGWCRRSSPSPTP